MPTFSLIINFIITILHLYLLDYKFEEIINTRYFSLEDLPGYLQVISKEMGFHFQVNCRLLQSQFAFNNRLRFLKFLLFS
jgi:hypothetical protein